ncbi:hypothetical protein AYX15_07186 [Cryptococcus neoformans]|nr:hypothetical protein AYX15_07186 [Cryptococcus neoformans var. grubii]
MPIQAPMPMLEAVLFLVLEEWVAIGNQSGG